MKDGVFMPFVVSLEGGNDRSFEDCERTWEEMKSYFSVTCIFGQLLLFLFWWFVLYTSYVPGGA